MYYRSSPTCWSICLLVFVLSFFSCNQEDIISEVESVISENLEESSSSFEMDEIGQGKESFRTGPWNMVYEETFEGSNPFYAYTHSQMAGTHSFRKSNSPKFKGDNSGRFELRFLDPIIASGKRSEILFTNYPEQKDMWYSFAVLFPSNGFSNDIEPDVLTQWHVGGGDSPPVSLRILKDNFRLRLLDAKSNISNHTFGKVTKDTWHEFVFHIVHSGGNDGLIEIWHNGKKVITKSGPNNYGDKFPRWKLGIFRSTWTNKSLVSSRVVYFDNVRVGNNNSSLEEMTPSNNYTGDWGPYIPEVGKLTLINAHTHKSIREITSGENINTVSLNTDKISITADMGTGFSGGVEFDLKGPKNFFGYDNVAPYALFRDDGKGNYFNGGGLPNGEYTLKITPYDDINGRGKVGKSKTITFKVVDKEVLDESIPKINALTLVQANINKRLWALNDGDVISLKKTTTDKLTIEADLPSSFKGSVRFEISGKRNRSVSHSSAPYTLYNYSDNKYSAGGTSGGLPVGEYLLNVTPFIEKNGVNLFGETKTIRFKVVENDNGVVSDNGVVNDNGSVNDSETNVISNNNEIESFTLIQSNINQKLWELKDGDVISLKETTTYKLSIEANLDKSFSGLVKFDLTGKINRSVTHSEAPYTIYNYKDGKYTAGGSSGGLPRGDYQLRATPQYYVNGKLVNGKTKTIRFKVVA